MIAQRRRWKNLGSEKQAVDTESLAQAFIRLFYPLLIHGLSLYFRGFSTFYFGS
jgi:hypothetical protein